MTIEERAAQKYPECQLYDEQSMTVYDRNENDKYTYIDACAEQQKIDIDKAWEYIKGVIEYASSGGDITNISKEMVKGRKEY